MREIALTKGYVALVDDEDYDSLSKYNWCAFETGVKIKRTYGVRKTPGNAPRGIQVDHVDRNGLNCQKYNLRIATPSQNSANSRKIIGISGYRGVKSFPNGRWRARIAERHIGVYDTPEEAARNRDVVAIEIWGEFAELNFPNCVDGANPFG